jgi:hypothetical protein
VGIARGLADAVEERVADRPLDQRATEQEIAEADAQVDRTRRLDPRRREGTRWVYEQGGVGNADLQRAEGVTSTATARSNVGLAASECSWLFHIRVGFTWNISTSARILL